jgi:hypothetical protein
MIKQLLTYRFNGPGAILVTLLAVNLVVAFASVGFFLALIQVGFSVAIAFLGNKAEIWRDSQ